MVCPECKSNSTKKNGTYVNQALRGKRIQRYYCRACRSSFSNQTGRISAYEHKPYVTRSLMTLLVSGVSQRRAAKLLKITPHTVARKLCRLGERAVMHNLGIARSVEIKRVIFDEMESFEHTKCKPVSIPLAVDQDSRRILAIDVVSMPAKGRISNIAHKKYGPRKDDRPAALLKVLRQVKDIAPHLDLLKSDDCPHYPTAVKRVFGTHMRHETHKGRRGCIVGQGELKRGGFDPLFSLNHTCAMIRDNIKRLSRRTWATTKRIDRLKLLVSLYAWFHNQLLDGGSWMAKLT